MNGILEGDLQVNEIPCEGGCQLTLLGPSAALVVIGDGFVYNGVGYLSSSASVSILTVLVMHSAIRCCCFFTDLVVLLTTAFLYLLTTN